MTLAKHLVPAIPDEADLGGVACATRDALDRMAALHARLLARLVWIAERVEAAVDLLPLPEPTEGVAQETPSAPVAVPAMVVAETAGENV